VKKEEEEEVEEEEAASGEEREEKEEEEESEWNLSSPSPSLISPSIHRTQSVEDAAEVKAERQENGV